MTLAEFSAAYREAANSADCGPEHETYECEFAPETVERMEADCAEFWEKFGEELTALAASEDGFIRGHHPAAMAGHDFWLTRNGHGAGFWDGDWDHTGIAEKLDNAANEFGNVDLYKGDDGLVYMG